MILKAGIPNQQTNVSMCNVLFLLIEEAYFKIPCAYDICVVKINLQTSGQYACSDMRHSYILNSYSIIFFFFVCPALHVLFSSVINKVPGEKATSQHL